MLVQDNERNDTEPTVIDRVRSNRRSILNRSTQAFNQLNFMSDIALREKRDNRISMLSPKNKKLKPIDIKELDINIKKAMQSICAI